MRINATPVLDISPTFCRAFRRANLNKTDTTVLELIGQRTRVIGQLHVTPFAGIPDAKNIPEPPLVKDGFRGASEINLAST